MEVSSTREQLCAYDSEISTLSLGLQKKAEIELNETPQNRSECLDLLRNMILNEPGLASRTDDAFLLRFLRARKFRVEDAFNILRSYYKITASCMESSDRFLPSALKDVFQANIQGFLPFRDSEGRAIYVFRVAAWNPDFFSADHIFRSSFICFEEITKDEAVQINGTVMLIDLAGISFKHLYAFNVSEVKKTAFFIQDAFPCRFQALHIVRESTFAFLAYTLFKPFLKAKLRNRIYFHGNNMESLHRYLPKHILPEEFGGTQMPFDNSSWYNLLLEHEEDYTNYKKYGYVN